MRLALGLGLPYGGGAAAFSPLSLAPFIWLDPSDLSTMFQERTGASATTPSVVDGVVGSMLDKASGLWFTAPSDAARSILRSSGGLYWLEFDGTDDTLAATVTLAAPVDGVSAWRRLGADASGAMWGSVGPFQTFFETGTVDMFSSAVLTGPALPAVGTDFVVTERFNGASSRAAIDNGSYSTGDVGTGGLTNQSMMLGLGGGGQAANMRFAGATRFDRLLTDPEIAQLRTYLAAKQGRVL